MASHLAAEWIKTTFLLGMYFLPGYIAWHRKVNNFMPIFLTNVFLGWTGIGWIICLIWSLSNHVRPQAARSVGDQATWSTCSAPGSQAPDSTQGWASVSATTLDDTVQKDEEAGERKTKKEEESDHICA